MIKSSTKKLKVVLKEFEKQNKKPKALTLMSFTRLDLLFTHMKKIKELYLTFQYQTPDGLRMRPALVILNITKIF